MTTPAGRYRVEERDRRLVTIDTLTGQEIGGIGTSSSAKGLLEAPRPMSFPKEAPRGAAPPRSALAPVASAPPSIAPRQGEAADWTTTLAGLSPGAQLEPGGTVLLSTKDWYDEQGDRTVRLSADGKGRLAGLMGTLIALGFTLILMAFLGDIFLALGLGFIVLRAGKAALKPVYRSIIADAVTV
jgi:hypothetical protein